MSKEAATAVHGREHSKKMTVYQLCVTALMAAVMCVIGPVSIPIGAVPISFTNLVIYLAVFLLGIRFGTLSFIVYLLLGMAGLPVFSGYTGGVAKLAGPTGGYLVGFIFMALICGLFFEKTNFNIPGCVAGMVLGTAVAYTLGTVWFVLMMKCTVAYALTVCVFPFLIGDFLKILIALIVGREVRKRLRMADLIA